MGRLAGVRACVFDAYGTVFDLASAVARCPDVPDSRRTALTTLWRDKQLQYTWLRTLQGRYADFWQVTGEALDFALDSLEIGQAGLHARLMDLYRTLDAFPEVAGVLAALRAAGFRTAILSNGSPAMLDSAVATAGLGGLFDAVLSVDAVGVFKTHPEAYQYALDTLGLPAGAMCFPVVQRLGRPRRLGLRHEGGLVQSLRPAPRAPAGCARPRSPHSGRFPGPVGTAARIG